MKGNSIKKCSGGENTREIGARYEACAADYLRRNGYEILEQNYRSRRGEIDLIGREGEYLCFVEVKYRKSKGMGYAAEAVGWRKQLTICRAAQYYMMRHGMDEWTPCRFDVVAIDGDEITLLRNAFEFRGR